MKGMHTCCLQACISRIGQVPVNPSTVFSLLTGEPHLLQVLRIPRGGGSSVSSGLHLHIPVGEGGWRVTGSKRNFFKAFTQPGLLAHTPGARSPLAFQQDETFKNTTTYLQPPTLPAKEGSTASANKDIQTPVLTLHLNWPGTISSRSPGSTTLPGVAAVLPHFRLRSFSRPSGAGPLLSASHSCSLTVEEARAAPGSTTDLAGPDCTHSHREGTCGYNWGEMGPLLVRKPPA